MNLRDVDPDLTPGFLASIESAHRLPRCPASGCPSSAALPRVRMPSVARDISSSKLSADEIDAIRVRAERGESMRQLSRCFEVDSKTIRRVIKRIGRYA